MFSLSSSSSVTGRSKRSSVIASGLSMVVSDPYMMWIKTSTEDEAAKPKDIDIQECNNNLQTDATTEEEQGEKNRSPFFSFPLQYS